MLVTKHCRKTLFLCHSASLSTGSGFGFDINKEILLSNAGGLMAFYYNVSYIAVYFIFYYLSHCYSIAWDRL